MNKKLLKNKNFMLLVIGNFVSLIGSNIQQFVLSLYVLALTGSATIFASMLAISILPRILLSPIAGVFGDWFDKKKSIVALDLINAVILFGFSFYLMFHTNLSILLIYVLVIILEITEIFFSSSMSAVIPSVVDKEEFLEANSLRTMLVSFGQLMAPIFGAIIYGAFGLMIALMINAISFLLSAFSELFIKVPKTEAQDHKKTVSGFKKDFVEGLKIIKNSKAIRTIIAAALIINFSIAPMFSVGLVFLIKEVLNQSDLKLGLLQTVLSLSMIAAPILMTKQIKKIKLSTLLNTTLFTIGLLIMLISLSIHKSLIDLNNGAISYYYILVICFMIGAAVTTVNIAVQTLFQKIVPIEFMGRTSTVLMLFTTMAVPLGQMFFGYLYDIINPGLVIILNGFIIALTALIYARRIRLIDHENKAYVKENILESRVIASEA